MDSCLPCSPEQRNNGGRWYVRMLVLAHLQSTNRAQIELHLWPWERVSKEPEQTR